ncbi:hypothetical protein PoB_000922100 [Plakobranchus ocellatus]|uniref:Uncharacterized protein n=1 Tax=Plakobranchus ocellatus TaxID=259542 RepID=A0AAV3Y633_9GAST|nr:hypothetical protein PoB_000922100 [Plakobranchus ocellatus]
MDACPEDLAIYMRESDGKEADLYLCVRKRNLCDQPRRSTQAGTRPVMGSVRPRELEKRLTGGQRAGEIKTSKNNQLSCFKCKRLVISLLIAHIQVTQ